MKRIKYITLLILAVLGASCSEINDTGAEIRITMREKGYENNIMPLSLDSYWVYEISNFDASGNRTACYYDTLRVTGTEQIEGNTWFKTVRSSNGEVKYYRNSDTALIERCETCLNEYRPIAFWPVDLSKPVYKFYQGKALFKGDVYNVKYYVNCREDILKLAFGDITAYNYVHYLDDLYAGIDEEEANRYWFKKDIGLVKKYIYKFISSKRYFIYEQWLLIDYELK